MNPPLMIRSSQILGVHKAAVLFMQPRTRLMQFNLQALALDLQPSLTAPIRPCKLTSGISPTRLFQRSLKTVFLRFSSKPSRLTSTLHTPTMASPQTRTPSFFLVPDEKINYDSTVKLGNVIYRVNEPDLVLLDPSSIVPPIPLGVAPSEKELKKYKIAPTTTNSSKYGLFAKILDFFNFGANISHASDKDNSESYEIKSMKFSVFTPPRAFLEEIRKNQAVRDLLRNGAGSAFLITGVAVATGVKFKSLNTKGHNNEGSFGVHAHGVAVGPSAKKSKKMTLELNYTDDGPTILGFRVQKLQLKEGELSAEPYVDGAYFNDDNKDERFIDFNAGLDGDDEDDMEHEVVQDELTGEEYELYLPNE
jgi:hypothetical protein